MFPMWLQYSIKMRIVPKWKGRKILMAPPEVRFSYHSILAGFCAMPLNHLLCAT